MCPSRRSGWTRYLSAAVAAVVVVGCGGSSEGESGGEGATEATFHVALLTSGPVSDAGWYAGAYEGLLLIQDSLGAEVRHQQTRTPSEFDEAFLSFAQAGYDVVFAHGNEYQDAAIRAGELFPDLTIIVSGGGRVSDNVIPLVFNLEEASYLAGMVAGGLTRSGTVGMVGGVAIPPAQGTFMGFAAGAEAVNPEVRVLETFIGNWNDVAAAKEATVAQLRQGADVIIHNTDAASFGVFQAVREAVDAGDEVWAMGMNRDQNDVAPEVILGSAAIDIPSAFLSVARSWQAGELAGEPVFAGAADGVVDLILNPALQDRIPEELQARVQAARDSVIAGTLDVPRVPFVEGQDPNGIEVVGSR